MQRKILSLAFLLSLLLPLFPQEAGVSRLGDNKRAEAPFVNQFGDTVIYPRLSRNGQLLRYSPLVTLDSVGTPSPFSNSASFYGNVIFDGWSLVTSRGFDYSTTIDFAEYTRQPCTGGLGQFVSQASELGYNQRYYVRAFASNTYGTSFSAPDSIMIAVGPVVIDTLQQLSQTPFSSALELGIAENGGAPLSGEITVFSDPTYHHPVTQQTIENFTGFSVDDLVEGLIPSTNYYVRAVLTNGLYSDTAYLQIRTPTDLTLSIESDASANLFLCPEGAQVTYRALLSGTDANKPLYQFVWSVSSGTVSIQDTSCSVFFEDTCTCHVSVMCYYLEDTLSAGLLQTISLRLGNPFFYVCTDEFVNTADATTTGISSIRWLDDESNIVATTNSVRLPTGYYTVEAMDGYGCVLRKEVYVGKKKLSCVVAETPGSNESARFEDGVWKVDSVSDEDGFWYAVTQIGSRCWLRQNLQTRHLPSTHQDLLRTGQLFTPDMKYPNNSVNYDPYTMPSTGALYNWCAAMDVATATYNVAYNFPLQHRGICPVGWHIPNENEIFEMADTLLKLYCPEIVPNPVGGGSGSWHIGTNTPIKFMLLKACYDSYTNPAYPQTLYDASNLSILPTGAHHKFWLSTLSRASMSSEAFYINSSEGVVIGVGVINGTYMPVRCIRNYPEE
ncbi:MAG: fibrobacter succinogenes major paralogous domain-containing protein [Bacteroidales bacterium]|nr:fibrobacter succinogenes major paralogous domain-containing protein [Bacteroidales bacterium]